MKKFLSMILAAAIALVSTIAVFSASPFPDVNEEDWFYDAVCEAAEAGIMNGMDGGFSPNGQMTRAQLVTVLARLADADVTGKNTVLAFSDTPGNEWYADYIGWGVETGIVGGYPDGTFKPDSPVLRQEMAALIVRFLTHMSIELPNAPLIESFSDAEQIPEWAAADAESLRLTGLIGGDGGRFNPEGKTTRAEFATVVVRYFSLLPYAKDVMYSKLENIEKIMENKMGGIYVIFGSSTWMTSENIGSVILPQLGLDTETYEIIVSDEDINRILIDEGYKDLNYEQSIRTHFTVAIRNKLTGEVTEGKDCKFFIDKKDLNIDEYVDPDAFDPGIDPEKYGEMMERSLVQLGDLSRLAAAFDKAESGGEITVAYIGGSITEGQGATRNGCFARISCNWLEKRFPDAIVNYVNAGISGTPSSYGNIRANRDVLSHDPDIVFVEFAVNDPTTALYTETYECLVRTALSYKTNPAVVLLFSSISQNNKWQETEKPVGEFYSLPMISVGNAVIPAIKENLFSEEDYTEDGTHPSKWGHQVYSDTIEHFFSAALNEIAKTPAEQLKIKPIPEDTYTTARFLELNILDCNSFEPDSLGSWRPSSYGGNICWECLGRKNEPFVFSSTCSNIFIICNNLGDNSACLLVSVDGGEEYECADTSWSLFSTQLVAENLDPSVKHTISVRVKEEYLGKTALIFAFALS